MISRHITSYIQKSLSYFPVVLLNGARQVGKSTLAKQLINNHLLQRYLTLDEFAVYTAAKSNPEGFLSQLSTSTVIDEIQRAPDLLRAIKYTIDENREPGRFLLTGSANILSYPGVTESLAGRMDIISIEGLSLGELERKEDRSFFIDQLFFSTSLQELIDRSENQSAPLLNKTTLADRIFYGSFPEIALKQDSNFSARWFSSYQTAYIERDVFDLSRLLDIVAFGKLLQLVGLRTGNLLNISNLAMDVGIDQRTLSRYLEILELTFQVKLLHPWHINTHKSLIKTPKFYLSDSGFACYLAGLNSPQDLLTHPMNGALFETWVFGELRKILTYLPQTHLSFYRTHQGKEVDFILTKGSELCGIECKWSDQVTEKDFNGLRDLQASHGKKTKGVILYTGKRAIAFSDCLAAIPITRLLD